MADYTLSAKITGDSSGFDKAIQSAEKAASSFEKKMESISSKAKSIGDKLSGIGTALTIGVTTPLAVAGKGMVDAASDFDENLNKISVAFGDSADGVKAWADTATQSFGLSMNQALEATSLFGDMATSMGISQSEAASMSTSLAGLAGDMASFKNIGIDEAMTALNGVFTGETESLKQLGIVMTEVNLQEFADGLGLVYDDMTQAEKVQLRYNYVMAMSKNAIGDYARTNDGTANSMRTFQASVSNLAIALGQNLLPIVTPLIQKATEMVNAFASADPQFQQLVLKIAAIAAVLGPALIVIGQITSSIGSVIGVVGKLGGAVSKLGGIGSVFTALSGPVGIAVAVITALVAAFAYLMTTNEEFRNSIMQTITAIGESLQPVLSALIPVITNVASMIATTIGTVLQTLAPIIVQIVNLIGQVIAQVAPLIAQLVSQLAPILTTIISTVGNIVSAVLPPVITIINAIMGAIEELLPPIMSVLSTVIDVVSQIIAAITPIISFVAGVISDIMGIISPIISFIAGVISSIISVISPIASTVASVFSAIFSTVSGIMNKVGSVIKTVFSGIKSAWNGLTSFVSGVFSGIGSAVNSLVSTVKGFVNGVIRGINAAIGLINMIPGVNIGRIPYLAHGTDNWQGGFAYMNEGGRGELTYLPNGAQVIPHDISVKYAKEAARANSGSESLDLSGLMEGMVIQVINNTNVDGTPLLEKASDFTIRKIGNQQKAVLRARGAY